MNRPSKEAITSSGIRPLLSLNFFMADMQAGIGPFLGVFLLAHGWQSGLIGTVMTVGGVAGMLMTTPAGALVDATRHKKLYVIIPGICTVIASGIVLLSQNFWLVTLSQVATAIAGAAIGPAVVRHHARHGAPGRVQPAERTQPGVQPCRQHGRRRPVGPARLAVRLHRPCSGWPPLFGVLSIVSVLMIPSDAIDDDEARGLDRSGDDNGKVGGITVLLECKPLLILAAALACFHLGNGAMLPLYGLAVVAAKQATRPASSRSPSSWRKATMIVASLDRDAARREARATGWCC